MAKRYEISDYEWEQIKELFPKENTGKPGCPAKDNHTMQCHGMACTQWSSMEKCKVPVGM